MTRTMVLEHGHGHGHSTTYHHITLHCTTSSTCHHIVMRTSNRAPHYVQYLKINKDVGLRNNIFFSNILVKIGRQTTF